MFDFITPSLWQIWIIIAVAFMILELTSGTLYLLCFSIGAVATTIVALFTDSLTVQLLTLAVVSALSVFVIRPVMVKYLHKGEEQPSNVDALIGRNGRVSEEIIANGYGRVAIDGDDWKAKSVDGTTIAAGTEVMIVGRDSLIITVQKKN